MAKAKFKAGDKVNWPAHGVSRQGPYEVLYVIHATGCGQISLSHDTERSNNNYNAVFVYVLQGKDGIHLVGEDMLVSDSWVGVDGDYKQINGRWYKRV